MLLFLGLDEPAAVAGLDKGSHNRSPHRQQVAQKPVQSPASREAQAVLDGGHHQQGKLAIGVAHACASAAAVPILTQQHHPEWQSLHRQPEAEPQPVCQQLPGIPAMLPGNLQNFAPAPRTSQPAEAKHGNMPPNCHEQGFATSSASQPKLGQRLGLEHCFGQSKVAKETAALPADGAAHVRGQQHLQQSRQASEARTLDLVDEEQIQSAGGTCLPVNPRTIATRKQQLQLLETSMERSLPVQDAPEQAAAMGVDCCLAGWQHPSAASHAFRPHGAGQRAGADPKGHPALARLGALGLVAGNTLPHLSHVPPTPLRASAAAAAPGLRVAVDEAPGHQAPHDQLQPPGLRNAAETRNAIPPQDPMHPDLGMENGDSAAGHEVAPDRGPAWPHASVPPELRQLPAQPETLESSQHGGLAAAHSFSAQAGSPPRAGQAPSQALSQLPPDGDWQMDLEHDAGHCQEDHGGSNQESVDGAVNAQACVLPQTFSQGLGGCEAKQRQPLDSQLSISALILSQLPSGYHQSPTQGPLDQPALALQQQQQQPPWSLAQPHTSSAHLQNADEGQPAASSQPEPLGPLVHTSSMHLYTPYTLLPSRIHPIIQQHDPDQNGYHDEGLDDPTESQEDPGIPRQPRASPAVDEGFGPPWGPTQHDSIFQSRTPSLDPANRGDGRSGDLQSQLEGSQAISSGTSSLRHDPQHGSSGMVSMPEAPSQGTQQSSQPVSSNPRNRAIGRGLANEDGRRDAIGDAGLTGLTGPAASDLSLRLNLLTSSEEQSELLIACGQPQLPVAPAGQQPQLVPLSGGGLE